MTSAFDEAEDADYEVPLQHKRAFGGAGLKRKRHVEFVPGSLPISTVERGPKRSVQDLYLSIVLGSNRSSTSENTEKKAAETTLDRLDEKTTLQQTDIAVVQPTTCRICNLPLSIASKTSHAASLAHQVCIPHAYPPSAIDRNRKGLGFLSAYGYDPDARVGLGASGDGRLYPVRAKERDGKVGIGGEEVKKQLETKEKEARKALKRTEDRKGRRKREEEAKKRNQAVKTLMFERDEIIEYLGVEL